MFRRDSSSSFFVIFRVLFLGTLALGVSGCKKTADEPTKAAVSCETLSGTPWVPNVSGAGTNNRDLATGASDPSPASLAINTSGPVIGLGQPADSSKEITVSIPMDEDLGAYGSLTLTAEITSYPSALVGSAYPFLVSLHDGTNELINLTRAGGADCAGTGYFTCSGPSSNRTCGYNPNCTIQRPSAFQDMRHWIQSQLPTVGTTATVQLPTCNWTGTASKPCDFIEQNLFPANPVPRRLRTSGGLNYTAKYVLIADSYESVSAGRIANFRVNVNRKKDDTASKSGALDVNVVLVGTANIKSSRTEKGKQNLNLLFKSFHDQWAQANAAIKLGAINVYEWPCANGGDAYSNLYIDEMGSLLSQGSANFSPGTFNREVNVFLVNKLLSDPDDPFTILGIAGGIPGPVKHGTAASGVVFSTQGLLDTFNPSCAAGNLAGCTLDKQDADFVDMGVTIAHEVGHYLGLNHPSERAGTRHDPIDDTPECTNTAAVPGAGNILTLNSCRADTHAYLGNVGDTCANACPGYNAGSGVFCPTAIQCQFNHVMWYTTKNFKEGVGSGDGNLFSDHSGAVLNYSPLVR